MKSEQIAQVIDDLKATRKLIREGWTQRKYVAYDDNDTPCFCISGALFRVCQNDDTNRYESARSVLERSMPKSVAGQTIVYYNDLPGQTQGTIVTWITRAIKAQQDMLHRVIEREQFEL